MGDIDIRVDADTSQAVEKLHHVQGAIEALRTAGEHVKRQSESWFKPLLEAAADETVKMGVEGIFHVYHKMLETGWEAAKKEEEVTRRIRAHLAVALARGHEVIRQRRVILHLSDAERDKLKALQLQRQTLLARIKEETERHRQLIAKWGEEGLAVKTHAARLAELKNKAAQLGKQIDALAGKEGKVVTVTERHREGTMALNRAMQISKDRAVAVVQELHKFAQTVPVSDETVANVYDLALQLGAGHDEAMRLTRAVGYMAGALGWGDKQTEKFTEQMMKMRRGSQITERQVEAMRDAGLDLAAVFKERLGMSVEEVNRKLATGKLTMKDVSEAVDKYIVTHFKGASDEVNASWKGIWDNLKDTAVVGVGAFMKPIFDTVLESTRRVKGKVAELFDPKTMRSLGGPVARGFKGLINIGFDVAAALGEVGKVVAEVDWDGIVSHLRAAFAPAIQANVQAFREAVASVGPVFRTQILPALRDIIPTLADAAGAMLSAASDVLPLLGKALAFLAEHWRTTAKVVGVVAGAFIAVTNPIVAVGAAIAALALMWRRNTFGIRDTAVQVWAQVSPILRTVRDWLRVHIAAAVEWLSALWRNHSDQVGAATSALWNGVLKVIFAVLKLWLTKFLPAAIHFLIDTIKVWITGWKAVYTVMHDIVVPILVALAKVYIAAVSAAVRLVYELIKYALIPVFQDTVKYISKHLQPVFQALSKFFSKTFTPVVDAIADAFGKHVNPAAERTRSLMDRLRGVFDSVRRAVQSVVDWLHHLADALNHLHIPDFLKRHSPSPLEQALTNIRDTLSHMPPMDTVFTVRHTVGMEPVAAMAGGVPVVQHVENHYHLDYTAVRGGGREDAAEAMQRIMLLAGAM